MEQRAGHMYSAQRSQAECSMLAPDEAAEVAGGSASPPASGSRVRIVRAAALPPAHRASSVRITDAVDASAGVPVEPLPPLLPPPRPTPVFGYPCQVGCSAWMQTKKVLPAIHAIILMHMQINRRRTTGAQMKTTATREAKTDEVADADAASGHASTADSADRMRDDDDAQLSNSESQPPAAHCTLPSTVRLPVYIRLIDVITAHMERADSQPASITASMQASQQLQRGVVAPGVCTLLPQLYAALLFELQSSAHCLAAATTDLPELRLSVELRMAVVRLLAFLLRDGHFALQFAHLGAQAEDIVAALFLQIDLAASVPPSRAAAAAAAGEHLTPLQLALMSLDLFTFSALPWTHLLSLLPDVLSSVQRLLLHAVAGTDTALTLLVVRHALAFLGAVWSRGMPWFLHRAVGEQPSVATSRSEREVLIKYQQCVGIVLRIDWTQLWSRSQLERASSQPATSAAAAAPAHWLDTYAAALSSASSSSFVASVSNLHRYALHLVRSWPHPASFHAHALPVNAPGLSLALIREPPSANIIVPVFNANAAPAAPTAGTAASSPDSSSEEAQLAHASFAAPIIDQQGFLQLSLQDRAARRMQWTHVRSLYLRAKEANRKRSGTTLKATSASSAAAQDASPTAVQQMMEEDDDEAPCAIIGPAARASSTRSCRPTLTRSLLPWSAPTAVASPTGPAVSPDVTALRRIDVSALPSSAHSRAASLNRLALLARLLASLPAHGGAPTFHRARAVLQAEIKVLRGRIGPAVEQVMWARILANNEAARAQAAATTPALSTLLEHLPFLPLTRQTAPAGTGKLAAVGPREQRPSSKVQHHDPRIARQGGTIGLAASGVPAVDATTAAIESEQFVNTDACIDLLRSAGPVTAEAEFTAVVAAASAAGTAGASVVAAASSDPADWSAQIKQARFSALPNRFYAPTVEISAVNPVAAPSSFAAAQDELMRVADSPVAPSAAGLGYTRMGEQELAAAMAAELERQGPAAAEIEAHKVAHVAAVEKLLAMPSDAVEPFAAAPSSLPLLADSLGHSPALPQSTIYTTLLSSGGGSGGSRGNFPVPDETVFEFLPYFGDEAAPSEYIDSGLYSNILKPGEEPTDEEDANEEEEEDEDDDRDEELADEAEDSIDAATMMEGLEGAELTAEKNGGNSSNKRQKIDSVASSAAGAAAVPSASSSSSLTCGRRKPSSSNSFAPSPADAYEYAPSSSRSERKRLVDEIILLYFARRLPIGPRMSSMLACELVSLQLASAEAVRAKIEELEACVRDDDDAAQSTPSAPPAHWTASLASDALNSFESLWCRRCFVYDCRKHGLNQPRACVTLGVGEVAAATATAAMAPAVSLNPSVAAQPLLLSRRIPTAAQLRAMVAPPAEAAAGAKRKRVRPSAEQEEESKEDQPMDNHDDDEIGNDTASANPPLLSVTEAPCGPSCFILASARDSPPPPPSGARPWTDLDRALLRQLVFVTGSVLNSASILVRAEMQRPLHVPAVCAADWRSEGASRSQPHAYCRVAALMGDRSCAEVAAECAQQKIQAFHGQEAVEAATAAVNAATTAASAASLPAAPTLERKGSVTSLVASKDPPSAPPSGSHVAQQLVIGKRMSMVAFARRIKEIANQHRDLPLHFKPCAHEGRLCDEDCHCVQHDLFCERVCGCAESCSNKFLGCRCPPGKCSTLMCTCFQAQRECDPDLCRSCECEVECDPVLFARAVKEAAERGEVLRPRCGNVSVLSGRAHPILLGRSATHGWGAFLGPSPTAVAGHPCLAGPSSSVSSSSPVAAEIITDLSPALPAGLGGLSKLRFLAEYTGELISHSEADRRGKIYDYRNRSYLFNLNDQYVVDAARKGNKTKFANHAPMEPAAMPGTHGSAASDDPSASPPPAPLTANCYPRIVLVRGDHRIGLYARRKIAPGEEILFDYKHDHHEASATHETNAPTWFKPLMATGADESTANASNRKGMGKSSSSGSSSHQPTASAAAKKKTATTAATTASSSGNAAGVASSSSKNAARKRGGGATTIPSHASAAATVSRSSSSAAANVPVVTAPKPPLCPPAAVSASALSVPVPPAVLQHSWLKQLALEPNAVVRARSNAAARKLDNLAPQSDASNDASTPSATQLVAASPAVAAQPHMTPVAPAAPAAASTCVSFSFNAPPPPPPPAASTPTLPLAAAPLPAPSSCSSQAVHSATVATHTTAPQVGAGAGVMQMQQHASSNQIGLETRADQVAHLSASVVSSAVSAAIPITAASVAVAAAAAGASAAVPPPPPPVSALSTSRLAALAVSATKAAWAALDLSPPTRKHVATGRRKGRPTNEDLIARAQAHLEQMHSGAQ